MDAIIILLFVLGAYFLPVTIAIIRGHKDSLAIGLLTLFGGWTGIGWIGALIWSVLYGQQIQSK